MPHVIDYERVVASMRADGFVSLYYNSGAWGFAEAVATRSVGWVGPPDDSIRPAARVLVRHVPPPFEHNLAELAAVAWGQQLKGPVWLMPKSHWAYELDFGSRDWMPAALGSAGIDSAMLAPRNDGSAIQFESAEREPLVGLLRAMLGGLVSSDFALVFPGRPVLCTVHHHKQLWWTTSDDRVMEGLNRLVPPGELE